MSDLITIPKQQDDVPWRPVRQRRDIAEHDEHRDHEQADDDRALCTHVRVRRRLQARRGAAHGDGVVHRLGEDEAEDGARDERRGEVRREVVVDEQLAAHDVEREVCTAQTMRKKPVEFQSRLRTAAGAPQSVRAWDAF